MQTQALAASLVQFVRMWQKSARLHIPSYIHYCKKAKTLGVRGGQPRAGKEKSFTRTKGVGLLSSLPRSNCQGSYSSLPLDARMLVEESEPQKWNSTPDCYRHESELYTWIHNIILSCGRKEHTISKSFREREHSHSSFPSSSARSLCLCGLSDARAPAKALSSRMRPAGPPPPTPTRPTRTPARTAARGRQNAQASRTACEWGREE